jgi:hypothetical protein
MHNLPGSTCLHLGLLKAVVLKTVVLLELFFNATVYVSR